MPRGTYERTPSSVTHLRNRLLAIGAETRYRELQAELRELVRLYPALKTLELPPAAAGNGSGPAPEALAMFRQRTTRVGTKWTPAQRRKFLATMKRKAAEHAKDAS